MAGESARAVALKKRAIAERLLRDADAYERGAVGEEATARALAALPGLEWRLFHDVRWPGRRFANIDHVVVGPQGIFVIDTKAWTGHLDVRAGVLRQNGHRRMKTVAGAASAAAAVRELLPELDPETVKPVLCFARVQPVFGWVDDLMLCSTENVVTLLTSRPKLLSEAEVGAMAELLAQSLHSATALVPRVTAKVRRRPVRAQSRNAGLVRSILGVVVVAGLVLVGLRFDVLQRLGDLSGRTIAGIVAPAQPIGVTQSVAGGVTRPNLDVTATGLAATESRTPGVHADQGRVVMVVEMTIRNQGDRTWVSEPGTSVVLRDEATASYFAATAYTHVKAGRVLPSVIRLAPGRATRGFVVFEVPRRTTITEIDLSVGPETPKTVRWSVD
jgi:hypothetical protein